MKVHELIKQLEKQDPDAMVIVDGYEDGYDSVDNVSQKIIVNANAPKDYEGEYEEKYPYNNGNGFKAVYLPRNSF